MKSKKHLNKCTVIVFSNAGKKRLVFRVGNVLFPTVFLALILFAGCLSWILHDYQKVRANLPLLEKYQKESDAVTKQSLFLAQRISKMKHRLDNLEEIDHSLRSMVKERTGIDSSLQLGIGGSEPTAVEINSLVGGTHQEMVRLLHRSLDDLENEIEAEKLNRPDFSEFLETHKTILASKPSIWPTKGPLSSTFGYRISPFTGKREFHNGIDIAARVNTPVKAAGDGIVISTGRNPFNGIMLSIRHFDGVVTKYAHLNKIFVKKGQDVKRGKTIALVGNTGRSTAPHLHYGVYLNGIAVNPLFYVNK
jgi:murein DD-endopeptidase MepM/ murein hydrolase activator NlpD